MGGKAVRCGCGGAMNIPRSAAPNPNPTVAAGNQINVQCTGCGKRHQANASMAGTSARFGCGTVISIPNPNATPAPIPAAPIQVHCTGCGKLHQAAPAMAGTQARCGCGTVVQIPFSGVSQPAAQSSFLDDLPASVLNPQPMMQSTAPMFSQPNPAVTKPKSKKKKKRKSDADVLAQYLKDDDWKKPDGNSPEKDDGYFSFEGKILNGGVIGGCLAMLLAVVWFFGGLAAGFIFFYPPVLFVIGLISCARALLSD